MLVIAADEGQRALEVRRKDGRVMGLLSTCVYEEMLWRLPLDERYALLPMLGSLPSRPGPLAPNVFFPNCGACALMHRTAAPVGVGPASELEAIERSLTRLEADLTPPADAAVAAVLPPVRDESKRCPGCPRCCGCARCDVDPDTRIAAARSKQLPVEPLDDIRLQAILKRCRQSADRLSAHVQQPIVVPWPSLRNA
jgi:hypothetical protein